MHCFYLIFTWEEWAVIIRFIIIIIIIIAYKSLQCEI